MDSIVSISTDKNINLQFYEHITDKSYVTISRKIIQLHYKSMKIFNPFFLYGTV